MKIMLIFNHILFLIFTHLTLISQLEKEVIPKMDRARSWKLDFLGRVLYFSLVLFLSVHLCTEPPRS